MKNKKKLLFIYSKPHPVHGEFIKSLNKEYDITYQKDYLLETNSLIIRLIKQIIISLKHINKYDILFTENGVGCPPAFLIKSLSSKKIEWVHLIADPTFHEIKEMSKIKQKFFLKILSKIDYFVGVSQMVIEDMRYYFPKKKYIITPPYMLNEKNLFNIKIKEKQNKNFIFVGQLLENKNILRSIEIFKLLIKTNNSYKLSIIGDGPLKQNVINNIKGQKNIKYIGHTKEIDKYLKNSDFLLHLPLYDSHPCVVLEAMAAGVIPITSKNVGTNYMQELPIINLNKKNDEIVEIIANLTYQKDYLNKIRKENRNKAKSFTKEKRVNYFKESFLKLIDEVK